MVQLLQSDLTDSAAPEGEAAADDSDDLEVEPVATVAGRPSRIADLPPEARVERLRRLALQLRVDALEAELDRAKRRRDEIVARYEEVLAAREDGGADADGEGHAGPLAPVFSWLDRR